MTVAVASELSSAAIVSVAAVLLAAIHSPMMPIGSAGVMNVGKM